MAVQSRRAAIIVDRVLNSAAVCRRTCERRNNGLGVIDINGNIIHALPGEQRTACANRWRIALTAGQDNAGAAAVHPAGGQHKAEHHQQHEHGSARSRNLRCSVRQIVFRRMLLFFYGFHELNGAGPSSRRPKYCSIACTIRCEVFPSPYGLTACAIFA